MRATRIIKTIEDTHVGELNSSIGQQVEIIIWPMEEESISLFSNRETDPHADRVL